MSRDDLRADASEEDEADDETDEGQGNEESE